MEQDLSSVKYVGPTTLTKLADAGITCVAQLAAMSAEELAAIPGIGEKNAPLMIASAQEILAQTPVPESPADAAEAMPELVDAEEVPADDAETMQADTLEDEIAPVEDLPADAIEAAPVVLSDKKARKQAKKARKAEKKAAKKVKKLEKAAKKAARKADKKASKKAKKAAKKAKKTKE